MITLSAFADEIGPDLDLQMDTCQANGVTCIDVRGIDGVNVSQFTLDQARQYKLRLDDRGFSVPMIGSPIGKIKISDDFDAHLELLKHCIELAHIFDAEGIRIFSFYPSDSKTIEEQRSEVMDRMAAMAKVAEHADMTLYHENEKAIFGRLPAGVKDIFATVDSPSLKGVFDPANYVEEGIRPFDDGWREGLAELTDWFHIKDKLNVADEHCVPAGQGSGQFREIFADAKQRGYAGYCTLEPHLATIGQFTGHTGPELFASAVDAIKGILSEAGFELKTN